MNGYLVAILAAPFASIEAITALGQLLVDFQSFGTPTHLPPPPPPHLFSSAEPMEVVACVVGVADVTARASSKIWRLCELWKDAPQDAYHLRDELHRAGRFFDALKSGMQHFSSVSPSQTMLVDLTSLLNQGHHTVSTFQQLFDELLNAGDGVGNDSGDLSHQNPVVELGKKRRLRWLKRLHKIKRLRASLRQTTEQVGLYLSLLNV